MDQSREARQEGKQIKSGANVMREGSKLEGGKEGKTARRLETAKREGGKQGRSTWILSGMCCNALYYSQKYV